MHQPEYRADLTGERPLPDLDLRPLSTGELLDRVFFLYRARIMLFLVIALVPAILGLVSNGLQLLLTGSLRPAHNGGLNAAAVTATLIYSLLVFGSAVLILAGYAISQAATTRLVSQLYLQGSGEPKQALRAAWPHTPRYIGIELWKAWSIMWLPTVFALAGSLLLALRQPLAGGGILFLALPALVYGFIAYLRNSLAIPASVIEGLGVRAAMRRTKQLVAGRKWRIFLLYLLMALLYVVAFAVQSPLILLVAHTKAVTQHSVAVGLQLLVSFGVTLLLAPIPSISLCLFYFDERVRREAFDIDFLLRGSAAAQSPAASGPVQEESLGTSQAGNA